MNIYEKKHAHYIELYSKKLSIYQDARRYTLS